MFHCAQSKEQQAIAEKIPEQNLQHDCLPMDAFDCHGWLHITILDGVSGIAIQVEHKEDHISYCAIAVPEDIKNMIIKRRKESITQISTANISFAIANLFLLGCHRSGMTY